MPAGQSHRIGQRALPFPIRAGNKVIQICYAYSDRKSFLFVPVVKFPHRFDIMNRIRVFRPLLRMGNRSVGRLISYVCGICGPRVLDNFDCR